VYDKELGEFLRQRDYTTVDGISFFCGGEERLTEGILTICSICHKIRGKKGLWKQKEHYKIPSIILYSHGICPGCLQAYYADFFEEKR
jgi:hypothetical protein